MIYLSGFSATELGEVANRARGRNLYKQRARRSFKGERTFTLTVLSNGSLVQSSGFSCVLSKLRQDKSLQQSSHFG